MKTKTRHVISSVENGWVVLIEGAGRASKHFANQQDAENWARQACIREKGELVIHRSDGTVLAKNRYNSPSHLTSGN
jgi:hypothetical protein